MESFSIMGALDGFGLGLYGEPINPDAWRLALLSVQRVLQSKGRFYLAAQIGKEDKLHFNSGRTFRLDTILEVLDCMQIQELHYIQGNMLDTYPCISTKDGVTMRDEEQLAHFSQNTYTALMEFQKL